MIELFDCNTGIGATQAGQPGIFETDHLLEELSLAKISGAMIHSGPLSRSDTDIVLANNRIYEAARQHSNLIPCPILIPNTGFDFPPEEEQVEDAIANNAAAAVLRASNSYDQWQPVEWCSDKLFKTMQERHLPAFCFNTIFSFETLGMLAEKYPELPFILCGITYREQRLLLPLLMNFSNIYLVIGGRYAVHLGLEQLVEKVGADRILFGTGLPATEAMTAISYLMYSDLSDDEKQQIGMGTFSELKEGISK